MMRDGGFQLSTPQRNATIILYRHDAMMFIMHVYVFELGYMEKNFVHISLNRVGILIENCIYFVR